MSKLRALLLILQAYLTLSLSSVDITSQYHASLRTAVAPAPEEYGTAEHSAPKAGASLAASPSSIDCIGACAIARDPRSGAPQAAVARGLATYLGGSASQSAVIYQASDLEPEESLQLPEAVESRESPFRGFAAVDSELAMAQTQNDPAARAGLARMKILLQMRAQSPMAQAKSFQAQTIAAEAAQGQLLPNYRQLLQSIQSLNAFQSTNYLPGPILSGIGSAVLNTTAQSSELQNLGRLVDQASRLNAPMLPRAQLEGPATILKIALTASNLVDFLNGTEPTVKDFHRKLKLHGIGNVIKRSTLVKAKHPGLPSFGAVVNGCQNDDIPIRSQAYVTTFADAPMTAGFFFRASDFGLTENLVAEMCDRRVPLNTTPNRPCAPYLRVDCLISQGMQLSFDYLRDRLIPTWQGLAGVNASVLPKKIFCAGHSRGAQMAALCSVFVKSVAPEANVVSVMSGTSVFANEAFKQFYAASVNESWVITNAGDPFPTEPSPDFSGLVFLFSPIWLDPMVPLNVQSTRALAVQRPPNIPYMNVYQQVSPLQQLILLITSRTFVLHAPVKAGPQQSGVFNHFTAAYMAAIDAALMNAPN